MDPGGWSKEKVPTWKRQLWQVSQSPSTRHVKRQGIVFVELNSGSDMFRVGVAFERLWITAHIFEELGFGDPQVVAVQSRDENNAVTQRKDGLRIQLVATIKSAFLTWLLILAVWTSLVLVRRSCTRWLVQEFCGGLDCDPAIMSSTKRSWRLFLARRA